MIYFMQAVGGGMIKIGSTDDIERRLEEHEKQYGCKLRILKVLEGGLAKEREIQKRFGHLQYENTEQFSPAPDLMLFLGLPPTLDGDEEDAVPIGQESKTVSLEISPKTHRLLRIRAELESLTVPKLLQRMVMREFEIDEEGPPPPLDDPDEPEFEDVSPPAPLEPKPLEYHAQERSRPDERVRCNKRREYAKSVKIKRRRVVGGSFDDEEQLKQISMDERLRLCREKTELGFVLPSVTITARRKDGKEFVRAVQYELGTWHRWLQSVFFGTGNKRKWFRSLDSLDYAVMASGFFIRDGMVENFSQYQKALSKSNNNKAESLGNR